jgi:N-methylhydantoinase A
VEPTVTDANVVLGYLPSLLDDQMPIHRDLAEQAVQQVATGLDLSLEQAARAIVDVANDRMLGGLRLVSVQRGHDPREFTLVAFGGAGPLHANALMELIGTPVTVIPPSPGVFSTLGFLVADMQREFGRSRIAPLAGLGQDELIALVDDLERDAMAWLDGHSIPAEDRRLTFQFGIRYAQQGYELPVMHEDPRGDADLAATLARLFEEAHERTYRFTLELEPELVVVRCVAAARQAAKPILESPDASGPVEDAVTRPDHRVYWDGDWVSAPVYSRAGLAPGHELVGPVIVEQEDSTTFVHPGTRATVDRYLNLLLEAV